MTEEQKEQRRARYRRYHQKHKEQRNAENKAYREANATRLAQQRKTRRQTVEGQEKEKTYSKSYHERLDVILKRMVERARLRSKASGTPFAIDFAFVREQYAEQKGKCYYTGLKFSLEKGFGRGSKNGLTPSLERVDNAQGYTEENTVIVCVHANRAKMHYDLEDLLLLSRRLARRLPKIIMERNLRRKVTP